MWMQDLGDTRSSEPVVPVTTGSDVPWGRDDGGSTDRPMIETQVIGPQVIDRQVIDRLRAQVSAPALAAIATAYLGSLPGQIQAIGACTAQRDTARLLWTAHDLKSASGTIGAATLHRLAAELEQAARQHDHAALDRLTAALVASLPATLAQLATACGVAPPGLAADGER